MDGAGPKNVLSHWREAREWWMNEPYREFVTFIDSQGIRRNEERSLPCVGVLDDEGQCPLDVEHKEEWCLRERKQRNEKFAHPGGSVLDAKARDLANQTAWAVAVRSSDTPQLRSNTSSGVYVPLHVFSGYSFGRSPMLASEIAALAALADCPSVAIVDSHSLTGAVEHSRACEKNGIKPLIGASIELPEGGEIVLIARSKKGYSTLSQLVTLCHLSQPRCFPLSTWELLEKYNTDLLCLSGGDTGPLDRLLVNRDTRAAASLIDRLIFLYGRRSFFLEIERSYLPWQRTVENQLLELGERYGVMCFAGGAVTHQRREFFPAQEAMICAHTLCLIDEVIGRKEPRDETQPKAPRFPERALNAERFLRTSREMSEHFSDKPQLLENTLLISEMCEEKVLPDRAQIPSVFEDDHHALHEIVEAEAMTVYGKLGKKQRYRLSLELERITRLGYSSHFLVAWDFCRWSREQGIQMSGRGSVIDSAVAFVLGLSRIDAISHNLHFDRFLPGDGSKRPDIDIDFEAHKRDDVRGYMVKRYGIEHVGAVCAIGTYCTRGIVREVGKVMGLPNETIGFLAKRIHGGIPPTQLEAALSGRPELRGSNIPKEKFRWVIALAERLMDVPRNIRTHSSGVVISKTPLCEIVPLMWSATPASEESGTEENQLRMIQWDKRSAKHFFDKFDVLCLRGQDVMSGVERRVRNSDPDFSSERSEASYDREVYRAMKSGELIGVPQSASPAMRQAHVRLQTNNLHDASLVQAGIRPGVGGSVKLNELIARRHGKPYSFEHPELERILGHTYGIIVFQEQVDQLLQTFAGYSSGQAEDIREAIHERRREDFGQLIREKIISKILQNGYSQKVADTVIEYVAGFKGYGFAQGHALAFAEISLRCVWMMQNHPAEYFASLLSAQPAGYYGPCTLGNEARSRGVRILPVDVNSSDEKFEVESIIQDSLTVPQAGIRVGYMQLSGLSLQTRKRILEYRNAVATQINSREKLAHWTVPRESGRVAVAVLDRGDSFDSTSGKPYGFIPFRSFFDFTLKVMPQRDELEALILCGAFDSLHHNRRALLWSIPSALEYARTMRPDGNPVLPLVLPEPTIVENIEDFCLEEKAVYERSLLGMDIDQHLLGFERDRVKTRGGITSDEARRLKPGTKAFVVGNPIRLRFPPTASGRRVVFFDLEDESGLLNVTCFEDTYQRDGHAIVCSPYVTVAGTAQDRDGHTAFLAQRVFSYRPSLLKDRPQKLPIGSADFLVG